MGDGQLVRNELRICNRMRGLLMLGVVSAIGAAATGCSNPDAPQADPKPSPTVASTKSALPPDPAETAKKDAVTAYAAYWKEMERVYATTTIEGTDIARYAAGEALSRPKVEAEQIRKAGRKFTGGVTVANSTVTKAELTGKVPSVTLSSCLDVSQWKVVESKTGTPVAMPTERLTKYVVVSTLERWKDGWKVIKDEPQEQSC